MAFCVPLATYKVRPSGANARALGEAPNRSLGAGLTQIVSATASAAVSMTLSVSAAALAQTTYLASGDKANALECRPTRISVWRPVASSMTETLPSQAICRSGSTRTTVPRPAGPVRSPGCGRRPPQLDT